MVVHCWPEVAESCPQRLLYMVYGPAVAVSHCPHISSARNVFAVGRAVAATARVRAVRVYFIFDGV